jgi:hypothetical protein
MSGLHCYCAYDECTVTSCAVCGRVIPGADKRRIQHDLCLSCKGRRIPERCRFKAGDRVIMPASPNAFRYHPDDPVRTGFRGVVEGWLGRELIGIRDDGLEWYQQPGGLDPEPAAEQLSLFVDTAMTARHARRIAGVEAGNARQRAVAVRTARIRAAGERPPSAGTKEPRAIVLRANAAAVPLADAAVSAVPGADPGASGLIVGRRPAGRRTAHAGGVLQSSGETA